MSDTDTQMLALTCYGKAARSKACQTKEIYYRSDMANTARHLTRS